MIKSRKFESEPCHKSPAKRSATGASMDSRARARPAPRRPCGNLVRRMVRIFEDLPFAKSQGNGVPLEALGVSPYRPIVLWILPPQTDHLATPPYAARMARALVASRRPASPPPYSTGSDGVESPSRFFGAHTICPACALTKVLPDRVQPTSRMRSFRGRCCPPTPFDLRQETPGA